MREEKGPPPPGDDEEVDAACTAVWSDAMRALGGEHTHLAEFPTKENLGSGQAQYLFTRSRDGCCIVCLQV